MELTLNFIPIYILTYSVGSFHSFSCFAYSSHHFGYIVFFLFSRNDPPSWLSLQSSLTILRSFFPSSHKYTRSLSSSSVGSKCSCYRSLIYGSSLHIHHSSYFTADSAPEFTNNTPWMSPIFNSLPFSLFTVDNISPSQTSSSSYVPLRQHLLPNY